MEHHQVTAFIGPPGQFEHASGGIGADDEQPIIGVDHADSIGGGVTDRVVADAMTAR